jgi:hypothetical protein
LPETIDLIAPSRRPAREATWIPDRLPRVDVGRALAAVELPLHLN